MISDWSNKKLKVGGIVLILSAGNNPFGTNKWKSNGKCIVNDVNIAKYYETIDIAGCDVWIQQLETKLRKKYPTKKSDGVTDTAINFSTVLKKKMAL